MNTEDPTANSAKSESRFVRLMAPGIDITMKLTPEQVSRLVKFALDMVAQPSSS